MVEVDMSRLEPNISDPVLQRDEGRTNLSNANLPYADLFRADLSNTILNGADFTCANLAGADFTGATGITDEQLADQAEDLSGATMRDGSTFPQQQAPLQWCPGP